MGSTSAGSAATDQVPLPAGTVTFLFTDIEGSTRRWEAFPVEMAQCVADHESLLRQAVASAGGRAIKSIGDGLMAVFDNADRALAAALAGQAAVASFDWSPVPELRVRMGIHQGRAEPLDGDYFGVPVNRAARVADSGHGGQIIVSAAAAATMSPVADVTLQSRGLHRLKDLSEPLELFQVIGPSVETELLPLRTLDVSRDRLPVQRTAFIGRTQEVREAAAALDDGRLVTLCGPGGVGKTRLALHIAADLAERFADGAHFVDLSNAGLKDDLSSVLLEQLGSHLAARDPAPAAVDALAAELAGKHLLLVLDNCEHLLDAAATLVGALLDHAIGVSCIVTSREPLRIAGEFILRVEPFGEGDGSDQAVEMFIERARAASGSGIAPSDLPTVAALCSLVDRLPLAIELAAARTAHLPLDELYQRLLQHHGVLVSRERDRAERHRTIEQLLSWSVSLLTAPELAVFARLSVFAGPVPLAAVVEVCSDEDVDTTIVIDLLSSLVDRSLVVRDPTLGTYGMLSLIRSFAADLLASMDDHLWARRRYWAWCARLGVEIDDDLMRDLAGRYAIELANAVSDAINAKDPTAAWAITSWSWRIWEMTGRVRDGIIVTEQALNLDRGRPGSSLRAQTCNGLAALLLAQGDAAAAEHLHREALGVFTELQDTAGQGWSWIGLSMTALRTGGRAPSEIPTAIEAAHSAIEAFEGSDDRRGLGHAHVAAGLVAAQHGRSEEAERHFLHALAAFRLGHHRRDAAAVLANLGNLAIDRSELLRAARFLDGAHQLSTEIGDRRSAGLVLNNLCLVASRRGDRAQAATFAREASEHFAAVGDTVGAAIAQLHLANVRALDGDAVEVVAAYRQAIERFRAAHDARGVLTSLANLSQYAWRAGDRGAGWRSEVERAIIASRLELTNTLQDSLATLAARAVELGEKALAARLLDSSTTLDADAPLMLEELRLGAPIASSLPSAPSLSLAPAELAELTSRERELLRLVGDGRTNEELANELYISRRTVDAHLSHIRSKLGITDRVKLAMLARDHL